MLCLTSLSAGLAAVVLAAIVSTPQSFELGALLLGPLLWQHWRQLSWGGEGREGGGLVCVYTPCSTICT